MGQPSLEIDLLFDIRAGSLFAAEFKMTKTPKLKHAGALEKFRSIAGADIFKQGYVVCTTQRTSSLAENITIVSLSEYLTILEKLN